MNRGFLVSSLKAQTHPPQQPNGTFSLTKSSHNCLASSVNGTSGQSEIDHGPNATHSSQSSEKLTFPPDERQCGGNLISWPSISRIKVPEQFNHSQSNFSIDYYRLLVSSTSTVSKETVTSHLHQRYLPRNSGQMGLEDPIYTYQNTSNSHLRCSLGHVLYDK